MTDAELRGELAALRDTVADLRREVAELRRPQIRSMRQTGRCPSCGGAALIKFRRVRHYAPGTAGELTLQKKTSRWGIPTPAAPLEAYACRACKLVEWNAATLDDVVLDDDVTEVIAADEPDADAGPYR